MSFFDAIDYGLPLSLAQIRHMAPYCTYDLCYITRQLWRGLLPPHLCGFQAVWCFLGINSPYSLAQKAKFRSFTWKKDCHQHLSTLINISIKQNSNCITTEAYCTVPNAQPRQCFRRIACDLFTSCESWGKVCPMRWPDRGLMLPTLHWSVKLLFKCELKLLVEHQLWHRFGENLQHTRSEQHPFQST